MKATFNVYFLSVLLLFISISASPQAKIDSLQALLANTTSSKDKVDLLNAISDIYSYSNEEMTEKYARDAIMLAKEGNYLEGLFKAYLNIGWGKTLIADYEAAIMNFEEALSTARKLDHSHYIVKSLNGIGTSYFQSGNWNESLEYYEQALAIAKKGDDDTRIASITSNIANVYLSQGELKQALDYHLSALVVRKQHPNDLNSLAASYTSIGVLYMEIGDYPRALSYFYDGLEINRKIGFPKYVAANLNNISDIYKIEGKYEESLKYSLESLEIAKEMNDPFNEAASYIHIGNAYNLLGDYEKALSYLFLAMDAQNQASSTYWLPQIYRDISFTYSDQGNDEKALYYIHKTIEIAEKENAKAIIPEVSNRLAYIQHKQGKSAAAEATYKESVNRAKKVGKLAIVVDSFYGLYDLYRSLGRSKEALTSYESYHQYYDSLLGEEKVKELSRLEVQFETEKKEQEIENLNQRAQIQDLELEAKNKNLILLGIIIILLVFASGFIYVFLRQKRMRAQQKAMDMEQRLLRTQMNPHFIFNAMSVIQDFMMRGDGKEASRYLTKFSKLIRQVLDNSRSEFISLEQEVSMLENYLSLQNLRRDTPFNYRINLADDLEVAEIAIPPMFAQPFVENAIEHGLSSINDALVEIQFTKSGDYLNLQIVDNGVGLSNTKVKMEGHTSHATQITQERIDLYRQLTKKQIQFSIERLANGTQVNFKLPFQYL